MTIRIPDAGESERGIETALAYLNQLMSDEPTIRDQSCSAHVAMSLMHSAAQHMTVALARLFPNEAAAQSGAMAGYASGLVVTVYQVLGETAAPMIGAALAAGINEGLSRARLVAAPTQGQAN